VVAVTIFGADVCHICGDGWTKSFAKTAKPGPDGTVVSGKGTGGGKWQWPKKTVKPTKGGWEPRAGNAWAKGAGKHGDEDDDQEDDEGVTLEKSIKDLEKTVASLEQARKVLFDVLGENHSMVKATEGELEAFKDQLQVLKMEKRNEVPLSKQLTWQTRNKKDMEDKLERTRDAMADLDKQEMQLVEKKSAVKKRHDEQEAKLQSINKEIATIAAQVAKEVEGEQNGDTGADRRPCAGNEGPGNLGAGSSKSPNQGRKRGAAAQGQRARSGGQDLDTDSDEDQGLLGLQ
jgi:hypothetical protein